jgi:hypothetical protein
MNILWQITRDDSDADTPPRELVGDGQSEDWEASYQ